MTPNYPHHLPAFGYIGRFRYSLTFCTNDRVCAFTAGAAVDLVWSQFLRAADCEAFAILICCFMPDHVHLLVEGESEEADLRRFVTTAKQLSGFQYSRCFGERLWQRYCYEHVLRDEESSQSVMAYILENPLRAGLVASVQEYPHFRSTRYGTDEMIDYACHRSRSG